MANILAYVMTNYSASAANAITGSHVNNNIDPKTTPNPASTPKRTGLTGDTMVYNFFNGNASKLLFWQYNAVSLQWAATNIIDPQQANWASPSTNPAKWVPVENLHGLATNATHLFAADWDQNSLATVSLSNYAVVRSTPFPTANIQTEFEITVPSDARMPGEAAVVRGNFLYVLYSYLHAPIPPDPPTTPMDYDDGFVVQYTIGADSVLTYKDAVRVGRNSITMELYGSTLYVCNIGGQQQAGKGNMLTRMNIININSSNIMSCVTAVRVPSLSGTDDGDFRDITIANGYNAYILTGHYDGSFSNFIGSIYHSEVADLCDPTEWTEIITINAPGFFWGIHAEDVPTGTQVDTPGRLWFIKGNAIDAYQSLPTVATPTVNVAFSTTDLAVGTAGFTNLNSACIIAPDHTGIRKQFHGQARLARRAAVLAGLLKE